MQRSSYRTHQASGVPGWGPAPGWSQPLPGWRPLIDHGPLPLRAASSVARWWWPTLTLASFGAIVGFTLGHDHPNPGLSTRSLITIALAALAVVQLTLHRSAGPSRLARATAEYTVIAVLAALLTLAGGVDQPPTNPTTPAAQDNADRAATAEPNLDAAGDRPGVLRVAAQVGRTVTRAIRAVTGAVGWLVELWRQADQQTNHHTRSRSATTPTGEAMPRSPALAASFTGRPL